MMRRVLILVLRNDKENSDNGDIKDVLAIAHACKPLYPGIPRICWTSAPRIVSKLVLSIWLIPKS